MANLEVTDRDSAALAHALSCATVPIHKSLCTLMKQEYLQGSWFIQITSYYNDFNSSHQSLHVKVEALA